MAIFTAIATAALATIGITSTFAIAVVATGLSVAASIGLSYVAKALSGTPDAGSVNEAFSVQGQITGGGDVPRSFILGEYNTAGSLVYANTWSPDTSGKNPNAFLIQVIALSDLPSTGLVDFFVNGVRCTTATPLVPNYGVGQSVIEYEKDGSPHLYIQFYDGTQTAADGGLVSKFATDPDRPYDAGRIGTGVSYVILQASVNDTLFSGIPTFKFTLKGPALYDPSKDSSVGGSGSQRWATPATWGGDGDNLPAVQIYNVLRGIEYGGNWFYGLQNISGARLPVSNWIAQIAKCREPIAGPDGPEPTYRAGGQITVGVPIADTVQALLTTCQGKLSEIGGFYKMRCGAPGSADFTFTDDNILSSEEQSFTPFFGLADTINGVSARYPDPDQGWNVTVAPPLFRTDLEAQDGNRRMMADVSFDLVPYAGQVQRLMKSALEEARRARRNTFTLPPEFWIVEPGDIGAWTSERNGFDAKLFRVDGTIDKANLDTVLDLTEVDPADYDWDQEGDFTPLAPGPVVYRTPSPQAIFDWDAEGVSILDLMGIARRPAIQLSWDGTVLNVSGVAFEVRNAWDDVVILRGSTPNVAAGELIITANLLPNTNYEVRGQYIPTHPRDTLWSDWLAVTTPDTRLSLSDFEAGLRDLVTTSFNDANNRIEEIADFIASVAADQDAANKLDKHVVRTDLNERITTTETNSAAAIEVVSEYAAGIDAAFASYQVTVNTSLGALSSSVTTNATSITTVSNALSSYTTTTNATLNGLSSSVSTNATAIATLGDKFAAQYTVTLDVNGYVSSLKAYNDGSFSSWTFVGSVFQVAFPGVSGGSPTTIFQIGTVNGSPAITFRGNLYNDGSILTRHLTAGSITAASGVIANLAVGTLKIGDNAITIPTVQSFTNNTPGNGANQLVNGYVVPITGVAGKPVTVLATFSAAQFYGGSGANTYYVSIYFNGVHAISVGGDSVDTTISASFPFTFTASGGADSVNVQVFWFGQTSNLTINSRVLSTLVVLR